MLKYMAATDGLSIPFSMFSSLPLAKLIPMLNARSHSLFAGQCDGIVSVSTNRLMQSQSCSEVDDFICLKYFKIIVLL